MVENLTASRPHRRRYTFTAFKAVVDDLARQIEKRHPLVKVQLRNNDLTTYSLSVAPRDHLGFATILFGIEDLDGKVALGGITVTTPERLHVLLERFWQVDDFIQSLREMEDLASVPPEGRVFSEPVTVGSALPFAFNMPLTSFQRMLAAHQGEPVSVTVHLIPRGDPAEANFTFDASIRYACFAGHWLRILNRKLESPYIWSLDVSKTIDPRIATSG